MVFKTIICGSSKAGGEGGVFGAGTTTRFLRAAEEKGGEGGVLAGKKDAEADRATDFVGGESEVIDREGF